MALSQDAADLKITRPNARVMNCGVRGAGREDGSLQGVC